MTETPAKAAGAFAPVVMVFLGGLIGGVVGNLFFPFPIWPGEWIRVIGAAPLAVGIWLFVSARVAFRRHKTTLMVWKSSSELVQEGPYRFTTNPMYLAFAQLYLSVSFIFNSAYILILLVVVLILFDRTQIPREERYLQEKFGEEYSHYKAKVRRWVRESTFASPACIPIN
jgi:protein-S-isoprenylcysteine O-methyltransferase Ste14